MTTTTHATLLLVLLSSFLMLNADEEDFTASSTEFITDSLEATPPAEVDSFYLTCDFDLENIESLLPYLPDICTEIFYNRTDNDLYVLYLEESRNFAKFYKKLSDYELRDQPIGDKVELEKYPFETQLRNETYSKVDWAQCVTLANSSAVDYLNCLKDKRLELAMLIPSVEDK